MMENALIAKIVKFPTTDHTYFQGVQRMIKLDKLPMPPTSNKLYSSFRGRLVKSKVGREFEEKIEFYALTNKRQIQAAKHKIKALFDIGFKGLKIDCTFIFHKNKVIGQKGQFKRIDASNRLKQTHDSLSKLIEIDDSLFFEGTFSKKTCESIKDEQVIINISGTNLTNFED